MYDKSILAKSTGASLGVVAIVGLLFMSTGTAFAMPVAGIGGFVIQADEIAGNGMVMYPGAGDAENTKNASWSVNEDAGVYQTQNAYPQAVVELDEVAIRGMQLQKTFDLQNVTDVGNLGSLMTGKARIVISASGEVQADTLMMKAPQIAADTAAFQGLTIDESPAYNPDNITSWLELRTNNDPEGAFPNYADTYDNSTKKDYTGANSGSPGLYMDGAYIRSTYLATNQIEMPGMALEVQYDPDNDQDYEWAS